MSLSERTGVDEDPEAPVQSPDRQTGTGDGADGGEGETKLSGGWSQACLLWTHWYVTGSSEIAFCSDVDPGPATLYFVEILLGLDLLK